MNSTDTELQQLNTLRLRSQATALRRVGSLAELRSALAWARAQGLTVLALGEGSNVVLLPRQQALVLHIALRGRTLLAQDADQVTLRLAAGENWHALVAWSLQQSWYGLENLALIPGTVGAAPIQNIGAYGRELAPFVVAVHGLRREDGSEVRLSPPDCRFGYRDSAFKHALQDELVITAVDLRLSRHPTPELTYPGLMEELERQGRSPDPRAVYDAVVALRRRKLPDPAEFPNAGSFFKNPVVARHTGESLRARHPDLPLYPVDAEHCKLPAAWLIERAGWKGRRLDGVGVHPGHALVLVNYGADDGVALLELAASIQRSVLDQFGVALEPEPRVCGQAT